MTSRVQGKVQYFKLIYMLPGQRDGTANWYDTFTSFLGQHCNIEVFPQCPALVATLDRAAGFLIHVDDVYGSGDCGRLKQVAEVVRTTYKCTIQYGFLSLETRSPS